MKKYHLLRDDYFIKKYSLYNFNELLDRMFDEFWEFQKWRFEEAYDELTKSWSTACELRKEFIEDSKGLKFEFENENNIHIINNLNSLMEKLNINYLKYPLAIADEIVHWLRDERWLKIKFKRKILTILNIFEQFPYSGKIINKFLNWDYRLCEEEDFTRSGIRVNDDITLWFVNYTCHKRDISSEWDYDYNYQHNYLFDNMYEVLIKVYIKNSKTKKILINDYDHYSRDKDKKIQEWRDYFKKWKNNPLLS